jgi:hypothetical protein
LPAPGSACCSCRCRWSPCPGSRNKTPGWLPACSTPELTEQGTADAAGVTDGARANAAKHYDEEQLAALVSLIALINATNRLAVITRQAGGDYQPGQFG